MTASDERTKRLVIALYEAKKALEQAKSNHDDLEATLLGVIDEGVKSITAETVGTKVTASVVRGSRIVIDEDRLKKQLGTGMWNKVTQRVLDKTRLEAAIALGDVDPNTVAMVSEEKASKPYFRFKEQEAKVTGRKAMSPHSPRRKIRKV